MGNTIPNFVSQYVQKNVAINKDELTKQLAANDVMEQYKNVEDQNGDYVSDLNDYLILSLEEAGFYKENYIYKNKMENLNILFNHYDTDGNGRLNAADINKREAAEKAEKEKIAAENSSDRVLVATNKMKDGTFPRLMNNSGKEVFIGKILGELATDRGSEEYVTHSYTDVSLEELLTNAKISAASLEAAGVNNIRELALAIYDALGSESKSWTGFHKTLTDNEMLDGIEFFNELARKQETD